MKKILMIFLLMIVGLFLISCGNDEENIGSLETNYYRPNVASSFKEITKEEFKEKAQENLSNKKIPYKYVGAVVECEKSIYLEQLNIEISRYYITGTINSLYFTNQGKYLSWITNAYSRYVDTSQPHASELLYAKNMVQYVYNEDVDGIFYKEPYSVEFEKEYDEESCNVKLIYDDSFLIESIIMKYDDNTINIKLQYFNEEDLPTASGEISYMTYQDIAYVKFYKEAPNFTQMKVDYKGTNIPLNIQQIYNEELGIYELTSETGNAFATLTYRLEKFNIPSMNVINYQKIYESVDIKEGNVGEMELNIMKSYATSYSTAFRCCDVYVIEPNTNLEIKTVYTNNPLTASISSSDVSFKAQFNEYGMVTEYTRTRIAGDKHELKFYYS